jgi:phosphonatase-like hydrolase
MHIRPALVVFDLAGTTVEDAGQVPAAFVAALAAHGVPVTAEQLAAVRGASKRQALLQLLPDGPGRGQLAEEAYASFRRELAARFAAGVRPVPGAEATFRTLKARGVRIAFNTGFDRDTTALLLSSLGWSSGVADAVVCGDDVPRGRPAPDLILRAMALTATSTPDVVASVGDTTLDLEAGHAAGVRWNVGVLSGAHGRERLERAPHTHILPDVGHLPALWDVR